MDPATREPAAPVPDATVSQAPVEPAVGLRLSAVTPDNGPSAAVAAAPAADAAANEALVEPPGGLYPAPATYGGEPVAQRACPDAGQTVIELAGGIHVGKEAARRVACDAGFVVLRHASDGGMLD